MLKKNIAAVLILAGALVLPGPFLPSKRSSRLPPQPSAIKTSSCCARMSARRRSSSSRPTCN